MRISVPSGSSEQLFEGRDVVVHSISFEFKLLQVAIGSFSLRGVPESIGEVSNKFRPETFVIVSVRWLEWGVPSRIPMYLPVHFVNLLSHPVVDVGSLDIG